MWKTTMWMPHTHSNLLNNQLEVFRLHFEMSAFGRECSRFACSKTMLWKATLVFMCYLCFPFEKKEKPKSCNPTWIWACWPYLNENILSWACWTLMYEGHKTNTIRTHVYNTLDYAIKLTTPHSIVNAIENIYVLSYETQHSCNFNNHN